MKRYRIHALVAMLAMVVLATSLYAAPNGKNKVKNKSKTAARQQCPMAMGAGMGMGNGMGTGMGMGMGMGPAMMIGRISKSPDFQKETGISKDQVKTIDDICDKAFDVEGDIRDDIHAAMGELYEAMTADSPDKGKADALVAKISQLQGDALRINTNLLFDVKAVFTADQWNKAQAYMDKRKDEINDRRDQRRDSRGGMGFGMGGRNMAPGPGNRMMNQDAPDDGQASE